jgi:hypothetical protein
LTRYVCAEIKALNEYKKRGSKMSEITYKPFDMELLKDKEIRIIPCEEALRDIIPIEWNKAVFDGRKKVLVIK